MTHFWLVRHGQSLANAGGVTQSRGTTPLTSKGRQQADALGKWFPQQPDLIVVSRYLRTRQTAQPLIDRFPHVPVEEWPVHEVTIINPKHYVNSTGRQRMPQIVAYWARNDAKWKDGDGSESFVNVLERADALTKRLKAQQGKSVAVFSHGRFMQAFLWRWMMGSSERVTDLQAFQSFFRTYRVANTQMLTGRVSADGTMWIASPPKGWVENG